MRRVGRYRRRGFGYLAVLGITMIVTIIGLSALTTMRIELRATSESEAVTKARFGAMSAIGLAADSIAADPGWRSTYSHDAWTPIVAMADFTYSFKLVDEQDGDLTDDPTQPVRLYGKATVADAVRINSVLIEGRQILETRIAAGNDDAEQRSGDGYVRVSSTDLEIVDDSEFATDIVGMRFTNVTIRQGAVLQSAHIQFTVDETSSSAVSVVILGEDIDDAPQFTTSPYDISSRTPTAASVVWSPLAWNVVGAAGANQRSADISSVIQEIVDRPAWSSGYALVIMITGSGTRTADAYEGNVSGAPLLHVEWDTGGQLIPVSGTWRRELDSP